MEIVVIVLAVILVAHVVLHPLRTLGCIVEVVVALVLAGAIVGILVDLAATGHHL
ncbi:hypothetical protein Afer_0356 [Acidimicrobium ferrooxidans DSM 10331]|uniref:Uncharacterized protein n=1 Tax=Acidimicrobium ferrooxidans (strain DSM 10331 / JCM 15462 / NBRC 103882 / ICP) TaxID=525909 RepID=C7M2T0_ACIFD|nr:hypothetical protein [Acidimicrobium ferrooxidans]ACU53324.1 hypothetical protein Afer_0356 [Acidimicrobium ferrooxidans DSM 10331]